MPSQAATCRHCGSDLSKTRSRAIQGIRERENAMRECPHCHTGIAGWVTLCPVCGRPTPQEQAPRFISLEAGAEQAFRVEAGGVWAMSAQVMTDVMCDFILERIQSVVLTAISSHEFYHVFGVGFIFRLEGEDREKARDVVRRLFPLC